MLDRRKCIDPRPLSTPQASAIANAIVMASMASSRCMHCDLANKGDNEGTTDPFDFASGIECHEAASAESIDVAAASVRPDNLGE